MEQQIDFTVGPLQVHVFGNLTALGEAAAERAASALRRKIEQQGRARIVLSAADSQLPVITALVRASGVDWTRVEVFHVDEYVGLPATHPASFRRWVVEHFAERVKPGKVNYLAGDAADVNAELRRYAGLLSAAPIDVALLGFGENGHIGFNDPQEADFKDPLAVRRVRLDRRCRLQQVGEGHFPNLDAVPEEALTLTCPTLVSAEEIVCCAPDSRKAEAVHNALEGPIATTCPGSILRTHACAHVYLDHASAALLAGVAAC
jgi:glucosamine-6-phosphate deaminase